jgi:hypothetical protein
MRKVVVHELLNMGCKKECSMNPASVSNEVQISRRVRGVRDAWSPHERRRRAIEGRRRFEQFMQLLSNPNDNEIWAAGALTAADLDRITHGS